MDFKKCILFTFLLAAITTLGAATEELKIPRPVTAGGTVEELEIPRPGGDGGSLEELDIPRPGGDGGATEEVDMAPPGGDPEEMKGDPMEMEPKKGSCVANLCFALDGSSSISAADYSRQIFLTRQMVKALPTSADIGLAAVQYGVASIAISPLTSDRADFNRKVQSSVKDGAEGTFLAAGINYCFSELFELNKHKDTCSKNKIIVMGDGNGNIGADPVERARLFEEEGGVVCTVAFGRANFTSLTAIAGDSSKVFVRTAGIKDLAKEILSSIGVLSESP